MHILACARATPTAENLLQWHDRTMERILAEESLYHMEQYMYSFKDSESLQADNIWHRQAECWDYDTVFVISLLFSLS